MKLRDLVPADVLEEMTEVANELAQERPGFDAIKDPLDRLAVIGTWCVRELVRMRKQSGQ